MKFKKVLYSFSLMLIAFVVFSCSNNTNNNTSEVKIEFKDADIIHELEFGGVYIKITIDDFNKSGFEYGDSVDISFTNNYEVKDIPYYNGYYVDAGETLLVGYPGYDYVKLTLNYGDDYWDIAKLDNDDKASIILNKKNKYLDIQNTMNIQYKDDRREYETDEEFANYRMINVGNIKSDILYRGASPCDNKHNRASYVDGLIEADSINFVINLADTTDKIDSYISKEDFNSYYFLSLYRKNNILLSASPHEKIMPLAMNMNYKSDEFRGKVAEGFREMLYFDGPYYIHCQEGKDRTGFVCIVIEALCGATYKQIVDDYMYTYYNYYKINENLDPLRYKIIKERNVDAMLRFLINDESNVDLSTVDFVPHIKNYLKNGGLSDEDINDLITLLTV